MFSVTFSVVMEGLGLSRHLELTGLVGGVEGEPEHVATSTNRDHGDWGGALGTIVWGLRLQ